MTGDRSETLIEHASCVAFGDAALLIRGPSGSGKSSLAFELISLGAVLIADDRVVLQRVGGQIKASAPDALAGMIEARGIGILRAPETTGMLQAIVSLDRLERDRLPEPQYDDVLGVKVDHLKKVDSPIFGRTLAHFMKYGRVCDV